MSTTTSGPLTLVVRRMIPSGSVKSGVFAGGVLHPFTQLFEAAPLVRGGVAGVAGGVGDAVGEAGAIGADADLDEPAPPVLPSQAASRLAASASRLMGRTNLRK